MTDSAIFSPDHKYRYVLTRRLHPDPTKKIAMCVGLNPSTAGDLIFVNGKKKGQDATITRLSVGLTELGYGGFYMCNLYGLISSKPQALRDHPDPWGENASHVAMAALSVQDIIFCWGNFKEAREPAKRYIAMYPDALCFGRNHDGSPWHPLAMMYAGIKAKDAKLQKFRI